MNKVISKDTFFFCIKIYVGIRQRMRAAIFYRYIFLTEPEEVFHIENRKIVGCVDWMDNWNEKKI